MSNKTDPYASEEETRALIVPDTRTPAQKKLDRMLDERGAWEQGAEAYPVLHQIAIELLKKQLDEQPAQQEPVARLLLDSKQNFERNFGQHWQADWIYSDLSELLDTPPQPAQQEPLFWYRPRSDGFYEGPIHNAQIEQIRKDSGGWQPLYTRPQAREPEQPTTPQGWKLVPVKPTPEQIKSGNKVTWPMPCKQVYTTMLAAAPQPAQQEQEPEYKGWYCAHCQRGVDASEVTYHEQHTVCGRVITDDVPPKAQQQEPVAWATRMGEYTHIHWGAKRPEYPMVYEVPLYTSPPASKPLTDDEFISMVDSAGIAIDPGLAFEIKEMVEAAHGIKGDA